LRNGNVGIGTTSPNDLFDVANTVSIAPNNDEPLKVGTNGAQNQILSIGGNEITSRDSVLYINNDVANDVYMVTGGGNVGIGTTSPSYALDVDGRAQATTVEATNTLLIPEK
jgi:hypothetical protein